MTVVVRITRLAFGLIRMSRYGKAKLKWGDRRELDRNQECS